MPQGRLLRQRGHGEQSCVDLGKEHFLLALVGTLKRCLDHVVAVLGDHDLAEADLVSAPSFLVHLREQHVLI